jgi:hypothetical protein
MTFLARIFRAFVQDEPQPITRAAAKLSYEAAVRRGDTRAMRETWVELKAATDRELGRVR